MGRIWEFWEEIPGVPKGFGIPQTPPRRAGRAREFREWGKERPGSFGKGIHEFRERIPKFLGKRSRNFGKDSGIWGGILGIPKGTQKGEKNLGSSGKSQRKGILQGIFAEDPGTFWECRRNLGGIFWAGFGNSGKSPGGVLTRDSGIAAQPGRPFMAPPPLPPHLSQVATPTPVTPPRVWVLFEGFGHAPSWVLPVFGHG